MSGPAERAGRGAEIPAPARRRLRIALGIHRLAPRGGLEDNAIRIAEELRARGHDVMLMVAGDPGETGLPVERLDVGRTFSNHGLAQAFARAFRARTVGQFDRTVVFQPVPGADILFIADTLRDRPDASLPRRLTPRFRVNAALERGCFGAGAATRIIGLAVPQMRAFAARYPESRSRIAVIPPTLPRTRRDRRARDPEARAGVRRAAGIGEEAPVWLWLGLQPRIKGLDRVVEALAHNPRVHLLVGGLAETDAKARPVAAAARRLGVAGRIRWLGYLSGGTVLDAMAAANLLAHPARTDVTGGVILEALVNGLPVVATDLCGFAPHIERSGSGRVVPSPFSQARFEAALAEVTAADSAAMSASALAYGADPALYSGIATACDLIEAENWPARSDV